jgi:hypothetical protein
MSNKRAALGGMLEQLVDLGVIEFRPEPLDAIVRCSECASTVDEYPLTTPPEGTENCSADLHKSVQPSSIESNFY